MTQLITSVTIFDKKAGKGVSIDVVKDGQKIKDGKVIGMYRMVVDHLQEGDI